MKVKKIAILVNLATVLILLATMLGGAAGAAAQEPTNYVNNLESSVKGKSKLTSELIQLMAAQGQGQLLTFAQQQNIELKGDKVRVVIEAQPGKTADVIAAVKSLGGDMETSYENLVQATVPIAQLEALADNANAELVRQPLEMIPLAISQGVNVINASAWQSAGINGSGTRVGILDVGFAGYSSLLGTDLPASVTTWWAPSIGGPGTTNHGTACAEVAYDVAPGALFYLANCGTDVEWGNAVDWLISQGVNAISSSIGGPIWGPGDGTGTFCDKVTQVKNDGIFWSQAPGNYGSTHYSATFQDTNSDQYHEFQVSPADNIDRFNLNAGDIITLDLKWDDPWGSSNNDYDLLLVRWVNNTWSLVAISQDIQNGNDYPREDISYTAPATGSYGAVVEKYSATRNVFFHLYLYSQYASQALQYKVAAGSLAVPGDSASAITVGAVPWDNPNTLENYSSQGPTTDGRIKPDLVAPTRVDTATYGSGGFGGTSASAPHAAGAAALVKQKFPTYIPAQIQSYLESKANDLGAPGKDNLFGSGRLNLRDKLVGAEASTSPDVPNTGNYFVLSRFTATASGSMTELRVRCTAAGNVKVAIYDDSSGEPGTLLKSVDTSTPVSSGWNTVPFSSPYTSITSGSNYWFAFCSDGNIVGAKAGTGYRRFKPATFASFTFPSTAGTGFTTNTTYYDVTAGWGTITPPTSPTVTNSTGASNITSTSARLNGEVTSTGGENPTVTMYYGTTDGVNTPGNWANHVDLGTKGQETFYTDVSSLIPNTPYYYRCYASNSAGFDWADTSAQFTTPVQTQILVGVATGTTATGGSGVCSNVVMQRFLATAAGSITEIKVKTSAIGHVKVAIYDDITGTPTTRRSYNDSSTLVNPDWNTISIPSTSITSGTYYWLAVISDSCNIYYHTNDPSANARYQPSTYSSWAWPASAGSSWNTQTGCTYFISAWGTIPPPTAPLLNNTAGADPVTSTSARLNGELTSNGNASTTVHIYWGTTDNGNAPGGWAHDEDLGVKPVGTFYKDISSLTPNTDYYYRCNANNTVGGCWSNASHFKTPVQTQILIGVATGTSSTGGGGGCSNVVMQRFLATAAGSITEIKVKTSAIGHVKVAIYDDITGTPTTRRSYNDSSTLVNPDWNTISIPSASITSGTYYWLAVISDSCNIYYHTNDPSATVRYQPSTYSSWAWPASAGSSWNTQTGCTYFISAWGTIVPPTTPNLVSPTTTVNFQWSDPGGATKYQLQVNTSSNFDATSLFDAELGAVTSQQVTGLTNGTPYYWRVKAGNAGGWSDWSTTRNVTVNQL